METFLRNSFLYLSKNKWATSLAKKHGLKMGAKRFVSGETLESAIETTKKLNNQGIMVTMDHLGEFVYTKEEAVSSTKDCIDTLVAISNHNLDANLSVKLTQLGLDISKELCLDNMKEILNKARELNGFVRIDMEDYERNATTIEIFETLKKEYGVHVGLVIQAYLYKSLDDVTKLSTMKPNLRICKGAYKESPEVAFPEKSVVDENYLKLVETHLLNGNYAAVATHDENMIKGVLKIAQDNNILTSQFEFQMLYGIKNHLLEDLSKKGYRTRIYIPYGNDWYGYFMRRLAERPANVWFVLKNLFK